VKSPAVFQGLLLLLGLCFSVLNDKTEVLWGYFVGSSQAACSNLPSVPAGPSRDPNIITGGVLFEIVGIFTRL